MELFKKKKKRVKHPRQHAHLLPAPRSTILTVLTLVPLVYNKLLTEQGPRLRLHRYLGLCNSSHHILIGP